MTETKQVPVTDAMVEHWTCKNCGGKLNPLESQSEPEGLRYDQECEDCGQQFATTKSGFIRIGPQCEHSEVADWCVICERDRRITELEAEVIIRDGRISRLAGEAADRIAALEDVAGEVVSTYDAYRSRGLIPSPDHYQRLVSAIKRTETTLAKREQK